MGSYTLEIQAIGVFLLNSPVLEIWEDGVLHSSTSIGLLGTSISTTVNYGGAMPSSLALKFNDGSGEGGRTIEILSVKINDVYINDGNFLSLGTLTNGVTAIVDLVGASFAFDDTEPGPEIFAGVTNAMTDVADTFRVMNSTSDYVIDGGLGRDVLYLGKGNDIVAGGGGNDIMRGGEGNDLLYGGDGDDRIYGEEGDDLMYGGAGNDVLQGEEGNDEMHGNDGDDRMSAHEGNDLMTGGAGDDVMNGGAGNDFMYGDVGNDQMVGDLGDDTLDGGDGDDLMYGGDGVDIMNGGNDNDIIIGDNGDDIIHGDSGNDTVYGRNDNDTIYGGTGNDILFGENGNDDIHGDDGVDFLVGGAGADTMNGGAGNDILHGHGLTTQEIYTVVKANTGVEFNAETNSFYKVVTGAVNYATALAAAQATVINGIAGHLVTITSAVENTYVDGLVNANTWLSATDMLNEGVWIWNGGAEDGMNVWNGAAAGTAAGGAYNNWAGGEPNDYNGNEDTAEFRNNDGQWNDNNGNLMYVIEWDAGLINDDNAVDTLYGGIGNDYLYGYGGDDLLYGENGDDILLGGDGNDFLDGGANVDYLYGGAGNDTLNGGDGNDVLYAISAAMAATSVTPTTILNATFNSNTDGFTYSDGFTGVGGSDPGNIDITGSWVSGDGNNANGSIEVYMDSTGNPTGPFSGSYAITVNAADAMTNVTLDLSYSMWFADDTESGENLYLYVTVDGVQYGLNGDNWVDELNGVNGAGADLTTGWLDATLNIGSLSAGNHTIRVGAYVNDTSEALEDAYIRFDDIVLSGDVTVPGTGPDQGDNILNGGNGNDVLHGSAGNDVLNGDAGTDTIYSYSEQTLDAAIANVLASNAGVSYNADTNSFYKVVTSTVSWTTANSAANSSTLVGLDGENGHLVTITTGTEQTYVQGLAGGSNTWLGGGDFGSEGVWRWTAGPESGVQFANSTGGAVRGWYNNWLSGQPNDSNGTQDYMYMNAGQWADLVNEGDGSTGFVTVTKYIIEWEGSALLSTVDKTVINGGTGADTLYGSDGIDAFIFDNTSGTDTIHNFDIAGHDYLDINSIISYNSTSAHNIDDYVRFVESGGNTTVQIDANGATGGASWTSVAVLNGVTGLNVDLMISADNLIVQ